MDTHNIKVPVYSKDRLYHGALGDTQPRHRYIILELGSMMAVEHVLIHLECPWCSIPIELRIQYRRSADRSFQIAEFKDVPFLGNVSEI